MMILFLILLVCQLTRGYFYKELDQSFKHKLAQQYSPEENSKTNFDIRSKQYQVVKNVVWFNQPYWTQDTIPLGKVFFSNCAVKSCKLVPTTPSTIKSSDAVIFHAVNLPDVSPPKRHPKQTWIFFGLEPPFHYKSHVWASNDWFNLFNWTMTYRFDSDVIHPYSVSRNREMKGFKRRNYGDIIKLKTGLIAWSVSNCETRGKRRQYVKQLQDYFQVDIYGKCGTFPCRKKCFDEINKKYKFYLAFENSFCKDYITEKFFRTQNLDVVAIVRGGGDYSRFYPPGTYINTADFSSVRELAIYLQYLDENDAAYSEYLHKKSLFISGDNIRKIAFCEMCRKLHDINVYGRTISNISDWLNTCFEPPDLEAYITDESELQRQYIDVIASKKKNKPILQIDY
ncbi:glycoprotein 3-alpha-L-fucosyltransferase A [Patella vulgata]|uniref:glycoprotein 3-alpha-L-fucosyltransferase A n=1 Tax=Patella vulgata TaxID=6465 RepID=UPI00217FC66D|nr:glycoprotein 3-alpha-L-fucosyltransferase A [Patella vulgata]